MVHTHGTLRPHSWPTGFGALNCSLHSLIFTSVSVGLVLAPTYLLRGRAEWISVHTVRKYGTKPIRYVTLHFRDRPGVASLRHRNRASPTVLVRKQKPYPAGLIFEAAQKLCSIVYK